MGGGGEQTTNTVVQPYGPSQPFINEALDDAASLYDRGGFAVQPYGGQRVAGFGTTTRQAQGAIGGAAMRPNAATAGQTSLIDMLQGEGGIYRDLDAVRSDVMGSVLPAVSAQFSGNGMTDSSVARNEITRAATQAIAPIEYGAYQNAQENQMRAAAMAPGVDQATYMPGQMLSQVGAQYDALRQAGIDADMARFYEGQQVDANELARYSQQLLGYSGVGGSQSSSSPGASTGSRIAGAGLAGLGMYGALAGAGVPYAAPLAVGAGLLGLF